MSLKRIQKQWLSKDMDKKFEKTQKQLNEVREDFNKLKVKLRRL
jgi:hypothetical protein